MQSDRSTRGFIHCTTRNSPNLALLLLQRVRGYPSLSKVREMMTSWALKKVPNIWKLSIQIIEDWLQCHGA